MSNASIRRGGLIRAISIDPNHYRRALELVRSGIRGPNRLTHQHRDANGVTLFTAPMERRNIHDSFNLDRQYLRFAVNT